MNQSRRNIMGLALNVVILALVGVLFFAPVEARLVLPLQALVVALLAGLALLQLSQLGQRRKWNAEREALLVRKPAAAEPVLLPPAPDAAAEAGVVQFLARLQEKGRLVDFLMEDITPHSNEQVGVVGRVVHQGCREVLSACFDIRPVHEGKEQEDISLAADFDAAAYRLVGKVPQHPPYRGMVRHHGWKTVRISLPRVTDTARESAAGRIIAPAEVEVG
jgi:hypothetical protein